MLKTFVAYILAAACAAGCSASSKKSRTPHDREAVPQASLNSSGKRPAEPSDDSTSTQSLETEANARLTGIDDGRVLKREAFVRWVVARNPSAEAARQAWRAAQAQEAQVSALEDPMLEYSFAPLSIFSDAERFGQVVQISQRLPWPGTLSRKGEVATARARAARAQVEATRQELAEVASVLFDRYYAVERSLEVNEHHRNVVEQIRAVAEAQYAAGRASREEPLQAELELAMIERERYGIVSRRAITVAQMNGLLHRPPEASLPPPPRNIDVAEGELGSSHTLRRTASVNRPELRATQARIEASRSAIELADLSSYPELGVMASYNSMWPAVEHQIMVGVAVSLPIQLGARRGAVRQAEAELLEAQASLAGEKDRIHVEVEEARQRLLEGRDVLRLYRERLLPTARSRVEAAQIGYQTGQSTFQTLLQAERALRELELEYQTMIAELGERRAELVRAVGTLGPGGRTSKP